MFSLRDIVLGVHLIGTILAVGSVAVTDALMLVTEFRAKAVKLVAFFSPFLSLLVWIGFFLLALSGTILLLIGRGDIGDPMFQFKMLLTAIVFGNGIVLNEYIAPQFEVFAQQGRYDLPRDFERRAMLSATISMLGWWGITFTAYFLVG